MQPPQKIAVWENVTDEDDRIPANSLLPPSKELGSPSVAYHISMLKRNNV
jgi:hypothetical protein